MKVLVVVIKRMEKVESMIGFSTTVGLKTNTINIFNIR